MQELYRVTIHGRILESDNLRQLLSRAVAEKRSLDTRRRMQLQHQARWRRALMDVSTAGRNVELQGVADQVCAWRL
ncbi:MAG: hypothetical protein HXY20_04625 [Acidobacteria bacterium]|nr:hypothetical protein [Acidobacteriota bacterium]